MQAFKSTPVSRPGDAGWVINDIKIGNHSQLVGWWWNGPIRRWIRLHGLRLWRRLTRWWPRKPPPRRPISAGGTMDFVITPDKRRSRP